jgi:hypothetical protein
MKTLSKAAQVAKLLKQKGKELGLTLSASSQYFAGGNSVDVNITKGSDKAVDELNKFSSQFKYGSFDGMNDIYNYTNCREDIPQTKYLTINDRRAAEILTSIKNYWNCSFFVNGADVRYDGQKFTWYTFIHEIKKAFPNDAWQDALKTLVQERGKLPFCNNGYSFALKQKIQEVA